MKDILKSAVVIGTEIVCITYVATVTVHYTKKFIAWAESK